MPNFWKTALQEPKAIDIVGRHEPNPNGFMLDTRHRHTRSVFFSSKARILDPDRKVEPLHRGSVGRIAETVETVRIPKGHVGRGRQHRGAGWEVRLRGLQFSLRRDVHARSLGELGHFVAFARLSTCNVRNVVQQRTLSRKNGGQSLPLFLFRLVGLHPHIHRRNIHRHRRHGYSCDGSPRISEPRLIRRKIGGWTCGGDRRSGRVQRSC